VADLPCFRGAGAFRDGQSDTLDALHQDARGRLALVHDEVGPDRLISPGRVLG
jgi:hypothetical protein